MLKGEPDYVYNIMTKVVIDRRYLAPVVLAMPWAGLGPMGSLPWIGPTE